MPVGSQGKIGIVFLKIVVFPKAFRTDIGNPVVNLIAAYRTFHNHSPYHLYCRKKIASDTSEDKSKHGRFPFPKAGKQEPSRMIVQ